MRFNTQMAVLCAVATIAMCAGNVHAQWLMNGNKVFYNNGKVGIGTGNPNSKLQVVSAIGAASRPTLLVKMTNTDPESFNTAIRGTNRGAGGNGIGIWGSHDADGWGVYGLAQGDGEGVRGRANGASGTGVAGIANGVTGIGVSGESNGLSGIGVFGDGGANGHAGYFVGDCYFEDDVGIGVLVPFFQLHLSNDSAAKPTSNTWTISSDRRLKKNITPIQGALTSLMSLRGVTYQWKNPESQGDMTGTYTGMIAQDVEKVFPEWVREDANGYKTLTVIGFEGIVVEALRELREEKDAEITELRDVIAEMRAEIDAMKAERTSVAAAQ